MSSNVFSLSNRSEEFRRVDYLLKLSLGTSSIHDVSVWHFSNPHLVARFEERTQDLEVLHAWVNEDDLENSLDTLSTRGFAFGASGQKFITGTLDYDERDNQTVHRLILSQIGVGRSYVQDETNQEEISPTSLPEGYDSIFIARPQEKTLNTVYRHEYLLFDPMQALPMYLVQFVAGPGEGDKATKRLTDWPNSSSNSTTMSSKNGIPPTVEALYDRYDFFDPVYYVPVSVRDKMVGTHSIGEAASHKLIGIGDAYDAAITESLKPDPLLGQRQAEIRTHLRSIDAKLRDVNRNSAEVEERIYKALQDALFQLQDATQEKMNILLSEEVELRRQLQHMEWIESYLDRQRDEAGQVDFLNAWKCHVQLRGDLCRHEIKTNEVLRTVQADLEFEGAVRVVTTTGKASSSMMDSSTTKRKQSSKMNTPIEKKSSRKGAGTMTLTGTPSPIQNDQIEDISRITEASQQQPKEVKIIKPKQQESFIPTDDNAPLDVSRVFAQAVRAQKDAILNESATGATPRSMEEVPPSPPVPRKLNKKNKGGGIPIRAAEQFAPYSLSKEAYRKCKARKTMPDPQLCFQNSRLISNQAPPRIELPEDEESEYNFSLSDAQILYLCLPPFPAPIRTTLLYSTSKNDNPSITEMIKTIPMVQMQTVDEGNNVHSYLEPEHIPTILVIKANGKVFGGFATNSWNFDGEGFGSQKCFLFSMDNDVKIPFVGRELIPAGKSWIKSQTEQRATTILKFGALLSDSNKIQFGVGDLVLSNDFKEGSCDLEHSFGIGLNTDNGENELFLCGAPRFVCEAVELWGVRFM